MVHVGALQQAGGGRAVGGEPGIERGEHAIGQQFGLEHAAVEQHGRGVQEGGALGLGEARQLRGGADLAAQQRGEVAGDGGILRVGQADLREARARAGDGAGAALDGGEEAFEQDGGEQFALQLGADGAADEPGAAAGHHQGHALQAGVAQQLFLGQAAGIGERAHLPGVELFAFGGQAARDAVGQGQVHVVAAEQDVFAHGHAVQLQVAGVFGDGNEREVAGAAAHIDDEDHVAHLHLLAPVARTAGDPAVERGLGFFQQRDALVSGGLGGLGREFACGRVERCGNGDGDGLLLERCVWVAVVPGVAQVLQVVGAGGQRRDALDLGRRIGRQDAGAAVHAGMAEPALGAGDEADGGERTVAASPFASDAAGRGVPGQGQVAGREFAVVRHVEEGGQQGEVLHGAGAALLGDGQDLGRRAFAVQIDPGEGAVRGAEVDADGVFRWAHSSTSAGAITRVSCPSVRAGRRTAVARQPLCCSVPVNGGWPTTLPVTRTAAASKPAGSVRRLPSASVRTGARSNVSCSTLRAPPCSRRAAAPTSASE